MNLYENITRRKSFRSFNDKALAAEEIDGLVDFLSNLTPPMEDIDWNFDTLPYNDMVRIASREPGVKAPMYLVLRAERKNFSLQKAGYIGEYAALYLASHNIATCWQGGVSVLRDNDFQGSLPFVSCLAFGYSDEPFHSGGESYDRKPLGKLAFGRYEAYKKIMEAARLAPSSYNRQPCVYVADDRGRIHLYRKKSFLGNPVTNYQYCVDAGCVLAHIEIAAAQEGYKTSIIKLSSEPKFKSFIYQATVELNK
jgi:nitroreductase